MTFTERTLRSREAGDGRKDAGPPDRRWHQKAKDWFKDTFCNIGLTMKRAAIMITVPTMVVATSCSQPAAPDHDADGDADTDADVETDGGPDADADADFDADFDDADLDGDEDEDVDGPDPDDAGVRRAMSGFIEDRLNAELFDRVENEYGNLATQFPFETLETDDSANPFSDGAGGTNGPDETFMARITGVDSILLRELPVEDEVSGRVYTMTPSLWVRGDVRYDSTADEVVADLAFLAYSFKFSDTDSPGNGIPVCPTTIGTDHTDCFSGYSTSRNGVTIFFLGEHWNILEMVPPSSETTPLDNGTGVVNGGWVRLGQSMATWTMEPDDVNTYDLLNVRLIDVRSTADGLRGEVEVTDTSGTVVFSSDSLESGHSYPFMYEGEPYNLHIYRLYEDEFTNKEARIGFVGDQIELIDGMSPNPDVGRNPYYTTYIGWKNRGGSAEDVQPDDLRIIVIYSDRLEDLATGGERELRARDSVPLLSEPTAYSLEYAGLEAEEEDYAPLRMELETATNMEIPPSRGPFDPVIGERVGCTVFVPFVTITSGGEFIATGLDGSDGHSEDVIFGPTGIRCGGAIGELGEGGILMRTTPASDDYTWSRYHSPGYTMTFNVAGASGTWEEGGAFVIAHELDADSGAGTSPVAGMGLFSSGLEGAPDFVFALSEDAGAGAVDRMAVGLWADGPSSSMNRDLDDGTGRLVFMRDMTSYFPAGPVLLPGELMHQEEGFYTGRGTHTSVVSATVWEARVAGDVVSVLFVLRPER